MIASALQRAAARTTGAAPGPADAAPGRSDADLVASVRSGEREAYGELVQRHQQLIYRHAAGMGLDHDTCLDLVQDAFVRAWTRLDECRDPANFRAWVFRIARNLCLDHLKNVRRATLPISTLPDAQLASDGASDPLVRHEVHDALGALPDGQREAFLLKHEAGYTYDEIAELTDTSVSAVKMRVHRARETLRGQLE